MGVGIPPMHLHMGQPDSIGWVEQSLEIVCAREQRKPLRHVRQSDICMRTYLSRIVERSDPSDHLLAHVPDEPLGGGENDAARHVVRRTRME
jgi:hypothetical protein